MSDYTIIIDNDKAPIKKINKSADLEIIPNKKIDASMTIPYKKDNQNFEETIYYTLRDEIGKDRYEKLKPVINKLVEDKDKNIDIEEYFVCLIEFLNRHKHLNYNENFIYKSVVQKVYQKRELAIFTENLKRLMEKNNLNAMDLARKLDLSYSTVNDWCNGVNYPRPNGMNTLAKFFNVPTQELTMEKNEYEEKLSLISQVLKNMRNDTSLKNASKLANNIVNSIIDDIEHEYSLENYDSKYNVLSNVDTNTDIRKLKYLEKSSLNFFSHTLKDNSMAPNFLIGDIISFKKNLEFKSGMLCAVAVEQEILFRKVFNSEAGIVLQPLNEDEFEPVFYSNKQIKDFPVTILGVAVDYRRKINQ